MQPSANKLTLTLPVRVFFTVAGLIVVFGSGLFLLPNVVRPLWPWAIAPFNSAFLGTIYLTELLADAALVIANRGTILRMIAPMSLGFTGVVTIVSLLYLSNFDSGKLTTYAWFLAYIGSVLVLIILLWRYRHQLASESNVVGALWHAYLLFQGIDLCVYGLGMLLAPATFSGFWPWKIDDFHSQVYSAVFISGGIGSLILSRGASKVELLILGITQICLGLFSMVGLILVDSSQHRVIWSLAGAKVWMVIFGWLALAGLSMVWKSRSGVAVPTQTPIHAR